METNPETVLPQSANQCKIEITPKTYPKANRKNSQTRSLPKRKLTTKQTRFISEYIKDPNHNGTHAALKVYDVKSADVARSIAAENLAKPSIIEEIRQVSAKVGLTLEKALTRLNQVSDQDKYAVPAIGLWADMADYKASRAPSSQNILVLGAQETKAILEEVRKATAQVIDIT